jgi:hypothetical protein
MTDWMPQNKPKGDPKPINLDRLTKAELIERCRLLGAKIEQNESLPNLPPAKTGELIEELHARCAKAQMLERNGL